MKSYEDLARGALARAEEQRKKKKKRIKICASALAVAIAVTAAVLLWRLPQTAPADGTVPDGSEASVTAASAETATGCAPETATQCAPAPAERPADASGQNETVPSSTAAAPTEAPVPEATENATAAARDPGDKTDGAGETFAGDTADLPAQVTGFVYTGEPITDEEAAAYFGEHLHSLLSSLAASGVNARGARVRYPGYSHMTLGGTGDVRLNYRDYQLWADDSLIAIVTLYRLDGQICATPSFGATWFASFAAFLRQHRGETLLFFYNGQTELVLTPANEIYNPVGETYETGAIPGLDRETLYCDEIAFIP